MKIPTNYIETALANRSRLINELFKRPDSLHKLLPYDEYISDSPIFQLKDGSLGAILRVNLHEHESMTEKQIINAVNANKSFFNLPNNCVFQVLFEQSAISQHDKRLKERINNKQNDLENFINEKKIEKIVNSSNSQTGDYPLERQTLFSIRYFPNYKEQGISTKFLDKNHSTLFHEMKGFVKELANFKQIVKNLQNFSEVKLDVVGAEELLDYLRRFFNPKTYYKRPFAKYNSSAALSDQFIYNSPTLDYSGITREGVYSKVITLKTSPMYCYPGGMSYFTNLDFPFKISLNFSFPTKGQVKRFFDIKEFFLQNSLSAKAKYQKEEIEIVQDRLARDDRCLHMTFSVIVEGESEEQLDDRVRAICGVFHNKLECEVINETDIGCGLLINSLPLCYTPDSDNSAQRYIRILKSDALNFIPVFDSFRGLKGRAGTYLSRENNLIDFALSERGEVSHTCIIGGNQRQQSLLTNNLINTHSLGKNKPLVFIIDKGAKHKMLGKFYNADITVFNPNEEIPFSPFRGTYDQEKVAFLTNLICSAVELSSPSFKIESEHKTAVTKAIKQSYVKKSERSGLTYIDGMLQKQIDDSNVFLTMEDIIAELGALTGGDNESIRDVVDPLLLKLKPFYGDGIYAKYFKGSPSTTNNTKNVYIYDLDALARDKILQTLITMSVTEEIRQILSLDDNKERQSFLFIKDFAVLGRNNPVFKEYASNLESSMTDKGCSIVTLATNPENYFNNDVGRTFWGSASNYLSLPMNSDQVDFIEESSSLIDEAISGILRSLRASNEVMDCFYFNKMKDSQGAFKVHLDNLDHWILPGNAKDALKSSQAISKTEKGLDAAKELFNQVPSGI